MMTTRDIAKNLTREERIKMYNERFERINKHPLHSYEYWEKRFEKNKTFDFKDFKSIKERKEFLLWVDISYNFMNLIEVY